MKIWAIERGLPGSSGRLFVGHIGAESEDNAKAAAGAIWGVEREAGTDCPYSFYAKCVGHFHPPEDLGQIMVQKGPGGLELDMFPQDAERLHEVGSGIVYRSETEWDQYFTAKVATALRCEFDSVWARLGTLKEWADKVANSEPVSEGRFQSVERQLADIERRLTGCNSAIGSLEHRDEDEPNAGDIGGPLTGFDSEGHG